MTARDGASTEVLIVGGGLVGSLASIYLRRRGFDVTIYERFPDIRTASEAGGRSINLVVASRGVRALEAVGLWDGARDLTVPVTGRMVHSVDGELAYQPYGRDESECNYSISRAGLNRFLITAAEERGVRFVFSRRLMDADLESGRLEFHDESGSARETVDGANLVVGADGAASAVRAAFRGRPGFEESMELLEHGYKELTIPAADDGSCRIDGNVLHVWPRGDMMLMALPDLEGSFTVTLYLPQIGKSSIDSLDAEDRVVELFERKFPDAIPLIPDFARIFLQNPAGELGTVRCRPWHIGDRVFLIGDAAHAIVPFFGQGMNAGFEDCRILDEILDKHGRGDWKGVLQEYTETRKPDADAIAGMALENFVEMRDRVGDPNFLLRKQVEHALEEKLPLEYRSRYSMVMYGSHIPYGVAREAGEIQRSILDELCAGLCSASELDWDRAGRLIHEKLTPYLEGCDAHLDY